MHSWPLASDLARLSRLDNDDAALNTWIVAWTAHILPIAPWRLFDAPIFYPEAYSLAYTDLILVPSLMGAALLWLAATIPWTGGFSSIARRSASMRSRPRRRTDPWLT